MGRESVVGADETKGGVVMESFVTDKSREKLKLPQNSDETSMDVLRKLFENKYAQPKSLFMDTGPYAGLPGRSQA